MKEMAFYNQTVWFTRIVHQCTKTHYEFEDRVNKGTTSQSRKVGD